MTAWSAEPGFTSWGRVSRQAHQVARPHHRSELADLAAEAKRSGESLLGVGLGRSYGDSGLNPTGRVIACSGLDRFMAFDAKTGVLRAEGGVSLDAIVRLTTPRGWFLPTTPGTRFVTLAGAVANDVHGKNHHRAGSFGCHVRRLGLIRSDRGALEISPTDEPGLFAATVGGLGLTGLISWVELQLAPIASSLIGQETLPFDNLQAFFDLSEQSARFEHVAAWIDCSAVGPRLGRGVLFRGDWAPDGGLAAHQPKASLTVPFEAPAGLFNRLTLAAFNAAYLAVQKAGRGRRTVSYASAFYPLDASGHWNRLYGPSGFYQHQFVVPPATQAGAVAAVLRAVAASGQGSFLAVLKLLGPQRSSGLISFPMEGASLALDFPNRGAATLNLLQTLDRIVADAGGRIYPAKDGRMSKQMFQTGYPQWETLEAQRDPVFESAFWRRVAR